MINLIQKERRYTTSWCKACTMHNGLPDDKDDTCQYCLGYLVTYHKCPGCGIIAHFFGYDNPEECERCGIPFPDLEKIKDSKDVRVNYHLDNLLS